MRAVAYVRVSSSSDEQLNSLQNQIEHYTELFKGKNYTQINTGFFYRKDGSYVCLDNGIFADEGITGTKKKNRKAFNKMLELAETNFFELIICKNVQRFTRNVEDGIKALKRLKQLGIGVFFEEGGLDSSNPAHEFVINLLMSLSQQESQSKSIAVKFGIRKAQQQGKWTSNRPLGYDRVNGYLQINNEEAKIVQMIYDMYVSKGYGHNKIANELNKIITNPSGKAWYAQRIKIVLLNPLYKGIQILHKSENMDVNVQVINVIPEHEWITTFNPKLQIIDDDLWQQAQDIYKLKNEKYTTGKVRSIDTNVFSTIVFCDNCGGVMRRKQKRTKSKGKMIYLNEWEWVCQNNDRGTNYCIFRNAISEDVLYDFVIDKINGYREQKYLLDKSFDIYLKTYLDNNSVDNQLNKIEMELQEITSERKNRLKLNDKGILTDDELKDYLEKEYRPKEKELFNLKLKYTNINKEIEKAKRQYKNFIKQINEIDINNFTNADIKKVFSGIYVGTYRKFITESFLFTDESGEELNFENKDLATRPFTWVNESKMTFKHISCEFNFMNKNEMDIFEDMAEKDFMEHYDETISELDNIDESNIIDLDTFKESAQNNINDDSLLYISHRVIKKALKLMGE